MDMTLCKSKSDDLKKICDKSAVCKRYLWSLDDNIINLDYQSYFTEPPFNQKMSGQSCDYFIDIKE